jgi:hypothetical protein
VKPKTSVDRVAGAVKRATKKVRPLAATAGAAVDDFILLVVGLVTLASALLGGLVLYRLSREPADLRR